MLRTKPAATRGNRFEPMRSTRTYWVLSQLKRVYTRLVEEHIAIGKGCCVVDYGCGNMPYRSLFPGTEYIGADFSGNELASVQIEQDGRLPLPDRFASVVLSSQVLEHAEDVAAYLAECRRVLVEEGVLMLSTHGMWRYHPDPFDFWRWTSNGLRKVLEDAGFDIVSFEGVLGPEATALQLLQDANATRIPRFARKFYFRFMQWRIERADARCDAISRDRDACVYVVVAKNPGIAR